MTSKIWVTSDQHFGHANIIKYCSRPFASVYQMNAALLAAWNDRVGDDDIVIQLGDLTFAKPQAYDPDLHSTRTDWIVNAISSLKGRIVFVPGNHDKKQMIEFYERELGWIVKQEILASDVLFTHRPANVADTRFVTNVHGHLHSDTQSSIRKQGDKTFIDAGVDASGHFGPVELCVQTPQVVQAVHEMFTS